MSQKSMLMNIILSGQVHSDFHKLGAEISLLGELMDQIGGKVRGFEKESVETYKNYETYMLEAQGALTAQYESQSQLARVMQGLDEHAQSWAASTIFDTRDVAKSISEAAHAGWDYEQMLEGIPAAMLLAQAGNTELSTGLDYVIKALNATGTEFEDADTLIDQWAMAANSGATNISELGEAILRMGATARFGDSTAELFTMLAVLADMGTVGADAGTLLRNSMIRLIAPTEKAADVMAQLGVMQEEAQEIAGDSASIEKANRLLSETGFSAYDSNGRLKPFLDTYKELYTAVSGMSEVDKNAVLSAIFPTRTITGALGLLEAAASDYDGLYESILGSDGYAERIAKIQTSGLMGTHEELESKWEEFSRKIGETLAPYETQGAEFLGGFIDGLNELDEPTLSALTGAMTSIALAGPALVTVGGALRLFSAMGPIGTGVLVTAAGLGAIAGHATKIAEIDFESAFGNLEFGLDEVGAFIDAADTKFNTEQDAISKWAEALATAQTNYLNLTTTLSEDLLSAALTGRTLTDEEIKSIETLGTQMMNSLRTGLKNAEDRDLKFIDMLFGDRSSADEEAAFADSVDWMSGRYDDLYAQAEEIGRQMREAMTSALADGALNEQERQAIQASVDRMNQIQAEIAAQMDQQDYYAQLHKAQSVSWDTMEEYLAQNAEKQARDLLATDELYHGMYGQLRAAWENEYGAAGTDAERKKLEAEWKNTEAEFNREWQAARKGVESKYGEYAYTAFGALMHDSEYADAWDFMERVWADLSPVPNAQGLYFPGQNLEKYLPEGVSADEMHEQLFEMYRAENGFFGLDNNLSRILEPFAGHEQVDQVKHMLDAAMQVYDTFSTPFEPAVGMNSDEMNADANMAGEDAQEELIDGFGDPELCATVDQDGIVSDASMAAQNARYALEAEWGNPTLTATVRVRISGGGAGGVLSRLGASLGGGTGIGMPTMSKYAEGGRATEASIFGEAGPEWAIPEEHSERTAQLLNLARESSGFTWGELIGKYGGLNGSVRPSPMQVTYAPTIHAGDAGGVERVLERDKERLLRMMRGLMDEMNMREDAEVYA